MVHLFVRTWDVYEKDLDDVIKSVKELDPTILDRWKPVDSGVSKHITFCDNISTLMEQAEIPKGVDFRWTNEDVFGFVIQIEVPVPELAKKLWPNETFSQDDFGDLD